MTKADKSKSDTSPQTPETDAPEAEAQEAVSSPQAVLEDALREHKVARDEISPDESEEFEVDAAGEEEATADDADADTAEADHPPLITPDTASEADATPESESGEPEDDDVEEEAGSAPEVLFSASEEAVSEEAPQEEAPPALEPEEGGEEAEPAPAPEAVAAAVPAAVSPRKGGFLPGVLGGLCAGVLTVGAAPYVLPQGWFGGADTAGIEQTHKEFASTTSATLAQHGESLSVLKSATQANAALGDGIQAMEAKIAGMSQSVEAAIAKAEKDAEQRIAPLSQALTVLNQRTQAFDARIEDLAKRPIAENISKDAIAAYEREIERVKATIQTQRTALEAEIVKQRGDMQNLAADQRAQIEQMLVDARAHESSAEKRAEAAAAKAALTQVVQALQSGAPFAPVLEEYTRLTGKTPPPALVAVSADGAPTLAALQEEFKPVARKALATARRVSDAPEDQGFGGFLRAQLGARSLTPQEGTSPDAVLSRAEAALRNGELADVATEIALLPEAAKADLSAWSARLSQRIGALNALDELSNSTADQ